MATRLCASFCLDEEVGLYEVDRQIAAANSIPEGAPVGTIALHPSGKWIAHRDTPDTWEYIPFRGAVLLEHGDDADSWPVIYDPTGKTIDELQAEVDRLDRAEDRALTERDELQETVNRILYTCSSEDEIGEWSSANDPVERFIEQFKPVKRIDPTAQQEPAYTVAAASEEMAKYWDNSIVTTTKREPRVLPSLDGEEARDGTEWKFRMNGELRSLVYRNVGWRYGEVGDPIGSRCGIPDGHNFIRELAPYIEVLGDPS